jgi:hypothetical protein
MNHGKINQKYYKIHSGADAIKRNNPVLQIAYIYFHAYKNRSTYMVAMKYHTAKIANKLGYTLQEVADLINVKNHATVNHLLKHYIPVSDHDEFIKEHYMEFIHGMLYPVLGRAYKNEKYTLVHISKIKANEERQQTPEPRVLPKEWPKF